MGVFCVQLKLKMLSTWGLRLWLQSNPERPRQWGDGKSECGTKGIKEPALSCICALCGEGESLCMPSLFHWGFFRDLFQKHPGAAGVCFPFLQFSLCPRFSCRRRGVKIQLCLEFTGGFLLVLTWSKFLQVGVSYCKECLACRDQERFRAELLTVLLNSGAQMLSWDVLCLPCITDELQWLHFLCLLGWILPGFPGAFPGDRGWRLLAMWGVFILSVTADASRPWDPLPGFRFFLSLPWHHLFLSSWSCKWCLNLGLCELFLCVAVAEWGGALIYCLHRGFILAARELEQCWAAESSKQAQLSPAWGDFWFLCLLSK